MTTEAIISANSNPESMTAATQALMLDDAESAKALIVSEGARLCAAAAGDEARAVVLTGSMSRGEATLKKDGTGWRVLGDATFLVLSEAPLRLCVADLERNIERRLMTHGISCKIAVVISTLADLRTMKPHIYAYELRERGAVVWGDMAILRIMPQFAAAEIPIEDGWWFLCNRMIEQLESAADASSTNDEDSAVQYRIAKLYLAMAACYLLAIGQYVPSYRERVALLKQIAESSDPPPAPLPLKRFSESVSQCTDLKLQGEILGGPDQFPQWTDAVADAEVIWRWVISQMSGVSASLNRTDLLSAIASRQPLRARAKGWVRAAYVQPSAFCRHCLRWAGLASTISPRYLVYGVAAELFFSSPTRNAMPANKLAEIVARLPLHPVERQSSLSWRAAARLVAHNFHVLLESTRS
jgi:hypothetical protein